MKAKKVDIAAKLAKAINDYKFAASTNQLSPQKKKRLEERIAKLSEKANRLIKAEKLMPMKGGKVYHFINPENGKIALSRSHVAVGLIPCDGRVLDKKSNKVIFKAVRYKYTVRFIPLFDVRGLKWLRIKPNPNYEWGTFNLPDYNG